MGGSYGSPAVGRLLVRSEFLAVAGARRKWVAPGLILQARAHDATQHPATPGIMVRVGLTASRKVGNAVIRNRARRRLRAAISQLFAAHAAPGHDFVVIARLETAERPYKELLDDLTMALKRLKVWRDQEPGIRDQESGKNSAVDPRSLSPNPEP